MIMPVFASTNCHPVQSIQIYAEVDAWYLTTFVHHTDSFCKSQAGFPINIVLEFLCLQFIINNYYLISVSESK